MNYSEQFNSNKIVVINDFINIEKAEEIYFFLNYKKPTNTWNSTTCFDNVKSDIQVKTSKQDKIQKNIKKASKAYNTGKFAFSFENT